MTPHIITISRQFGSGGRTIGKEVAARLHIPCYDEELINQIAQQSGLSRSYIADRGEYASASNLLSSLIAARDRNGHSLRDELWNMQQEIILGLAAKGPCVIVGRCADYILRDRKDLLTVFIHAPLEDRARRIVERYGERPEQPEQRLRDKDKRRRAYYQIYTDTQWGDAANYHLSLDSGALGLERCVDIISRVYLK